MAFGLLWYALAFLAIVRTATTPSAVFMRAGSNKVVWLVLPLIFGFLGAAYFYMFVSPRLSVASEALTQLS